MRIYMLCQLINTFWQGPRKNHWIFLDPRPAMFPETKPIEVTWLPLTLYFLINILFSSETTQRKLLNFFPSHSQPKQIEKIEIWHLVYNVIYLFQNVFHCLVYTATLGPKGFYKVNTDYSANRKLWPVQMCQECCSVQSEASFVLLQFH